MSNLPTDEEYLNQLYESLKDDEWVEMRKRAGQASDPEAMARQAISEGTFTHDQYDALVGALRESDNPSSYFRGQFIGLLRNMALLMLVPRRQKLERVPVGCVPTRQLNAGAYRTPRGGAVSSN
jgi:hypothetical protein